MSADAQNPIGVGELTDAIRQTLQHDFRGIWVTGQVSNLSRPRSGHLYLNLKDDQAVIAAAIWRNVAERIPFELEEGLEVVCRGDIDVYPPRGSYQLIVREVLPRGIGALELAFRKRFELLQAEGLFDEGLKRPLPRFPRTVAFVTSPSGAAVRDFIRIAKRRWPSLRLMIVPSNVQGAEAAGEIVAGIERVNRLRGTDRPDVLVVGRGGGSLEDLWCFNEESVVRAIRGSAIPTVSAVGHEIDVSLSDLAADLRAATPSEAAERIVPSLDEFSHRLDRLRESLDDRLRGKAAEARRRLEGLASRPVLARPLDRIHLLQQRLDPWERRMELAARARCEREAQRLAGIAGRLESVSPLAILARGYAVARHPSDGDSPGGGDGGRPIVSVNEATVGERLEIRLLDGRLATRIEQIERLI